MALFPGDMSIGWGFGLEPQEEDELDDDSQLFITPLGREYLAELEAKEPHLTDPLLAVSELEEKVDKVMDYLGTQVQSTEQRITDLEERLRSLTIVVNSVVEAVQANEPAYVQSEKE